MKEHPILFNTEMVKAILDGRKTQTRRVITGKALEWVSHVNISEVGDTAIFLCPYGQVKGGRFWVRETWASLETMDSESPCEISPQFSPVFYKTDGDDFPGWINKGKWRPSIFMPRWASRITLEITVIRVEQVQEITKEDIWAEGITESFVDGDENYAFENWVKPYRELWDSLNAKRGYSWESNPWVWVLEFKRISP